MNFLPAYLTFFASNVADISLSVTAGIFLFCSLCLIP